MALKSRTNLTDEEMKFYSAVIIRATSATFGQPYIGMAILKLHPVAVPGLRTMGVDKHWRVYVDFDYMMERGVEFAAGVMAHEPWHLLRDHNTRFDNHVGDTSKNKVWNIAGDLEINDDIRNKLPDDSIFPGVADFAKYTVGCTAETYFEQLVKDEDVLNKYAPQPKCTCGEKKDDKGKGKDEGDQDGGKQPGDADGAGEGEGEDGEGEGQPGGQGGSGDEDGEGEGEGGSGSGQGGGTPQPGQGNGYDPNCPTHGHDDGQGGGQGNGPSQPGTGKGFRPECGSGAGGQPGEYELPYDEDNSVGQEDAKEVRRQVAEAAKQYAKSHPGDVPGFVSDWAKEVLSHTPVNWRRVLSGSFRRAVQWKRGMQDYDRKRVRRRQPIAGVLLPGMRSPKPQILVGIDTSGSNMHKVPVVLHELKKIMTSMGVRDEELRAFAVDVDVDKVNPVRNPFTVLDNSRMYGGTDMRPAYKFAAKIKPAADIFVLCTDGEVGGKSGWDSKPPAGRKMKYITVLLVDESHDWSKSIIEDARATVGLWSDIVVVDISQE